MTTKKPASDGGTKPSALPHYDVSEGFLRAEANPDTTICEKAD